MIGYTFRLAHLEEITVSRGDLIHRGDKIGTMGNTGQSTGPHGHIDVVQGVHDWVYRLQDMYEGSPKPDFRELQYFIDTELCGGGPFRITTHVYDYRYKPQGTWKPHPGYDIVIDDPDPVFYWNRSFDGTVVETGFDEGYGNYVQIYYDKVGQ